MELRSCIRSSRSRSRTPMTLSVFEQDTLQESHVEHSFSKNVKRTTTTKVRTGNGSSTVDSIDEEYNSNSRYTEPSSTSKRKTRSAKFFKTSDYSSEEGENEVSSTRSISENEKNRILEDAKKAADNPSGITALALYRKAKRYWDEYPKTDWTYSPFSKDRVEIAPGVVAMPNMSRRHISSYDKYTHAESFYSSSMKPNRLFSERTYTSERTTATTIVKRFFFRIFVLIVSTVYLMWRSVTYILESAHSLSLRVAKNVYRITSRVMLMDTWLLRKRGNRGKAASLVVLCLLPLLLLVGWWIASNISEIHEKFYIPFTTSPATAKTDQVQSFSSPDGGAPEVNREKTDGAQNIVSDLTRDQLETVANLVKSQLDVRDYVDYDQVLDRLLNTEAVRMTINNYIAHSQSNQAESELNEKMEKQRLIIEELKDELGMMRLELSNLNRCCKKSGYLDLQVFRSLTSLLNNPDFLQRQEGLKSWLNSLFVAKIELENKLSNLTKTLDEKFDGLIETSNKFLIDKVVAKLSLEVNKYKADASLETDGVSSLTDERIKDIVKGILKIYDADRTGLVDYAMEPVGGQIITTRCTESYHTGSAVLSILGLPLWYPTSTPRTVITPGINPGECWAFQNFPGLLVIKLMAPIRIEAFSLEHISKLLVPEGKIDSAPKDFEVYGLGHEEDRNGIKIGEYRYDYNGESLQYFVAENPDQTFEYIELRIISNHGNPNYTCLYRFRVHGQKQAKSS